MRHSCHQLCATSGLLVQEATTSPTFKAQTSKPLITAEGPADPACPDGSGVCYVCGSTEHTAQACTRPRKGPAKGGSAGGSGGGSGSGRPDQGGSRGRAPSRGSGKGNKDGRSG
eukprot:6442889-Amphidinium_carterae.1